MGCLMGSNNWNSQKQNTLQTLNQNLQDLNFLSSSLSDFLLRLHLLGQEVQPLLHFISLGLSGRRIPPSSKAKAVTGVTQETAHLEQPTWLGNARAITRYTWTKSGEEVSPPKQKQRRSLLLLTQSKFFHWGSFPFPSPITYNLHPRYLLRKPNSVL